ncbi:hypothetical protein L0V05_17480 [Tabrizicola sp. J26]|uniref:hypothetical protein n=1 Tax=Alitabrizicola rongguiensis TaxID=2909234 RepID=UPI001F30E853|nr:hypothetical protein [Tabrizicola rongguiensis]MCF1710604.1 hypothetical protein [Tabrizicola rongguiensis]
MSRIRLIILNSVTAIAVAGAAVTASSGPVSARDNDDGWKVILGIAAGALAVGALAPRGSLAAPVTRYAPAPVYVDPPRYAGPTPVYVYPGRPGYGQPAWQDDGWEEGNWRDDDWREHDRRHRHNHRRAEPPVYYTQPGWTPWR